MGQCTGTYKISANGYTLWFQVELQLAFDVHKATHTNTIILGGLFYGTYDNKSFVTSKKLGQAYR